SLTCEQALYEAVQQVNQPADQPAQPTTSHRTTCEEPRSACLKGRLVVSQSGSPEFDRPANRQVTPEACSLTCEQALYEAVQQVNQPADQPAQPTTSHRTTQCVLQAAR
ncbi:hypothetical protein ABZ896_19970, partial [Streptomyces sp. NPDC047072]|uniref:hypothetical protein n=1 Tax=Streptomyces sp. NPDC047072 TaxID=3154809 RepID=UPI00340A0AC2